MSESFDDIPIRVCGGSRLKFVTESLRHSITCTHFLYDSLGIARAHVRLPLLRRPFLVSINGVEAWGDDQDAWPIHEWSAFRRQQMGLADKRAVHLQDVTI